MRIARYEPTPNPNALKCVLAEGAARAPTPPASPAGPRSFRSAAEAAVDPLAARIFAIPGVTNLLLNETWLTVNKAADAKWPAIKSALEKVLATE